MDTTNLINQNSQMVALVREYRDKIRSIKDDLTIPDQNKHILLDREREAFKTRLNNQRLAFDAAANDLRQQADSVAGRSYGPVSGDAAAGHAEDEKAFRRLSMLVEAGVEPQQIIQDAAARNDTRMIRVAADDLRTLLWAKTGDADAYANIAPEVDQAKYDTGSAAYRAAVDAKKQVDDLAATYEFNATSVEKELAGQPDAAAALLSHDRTVIRTDEGQ